MTKTVKTRINKLRKKLPRNYRAQVAKMAGNLDASAVKSVFQGSTTDPERVEKVLRAAEKLADKHQERLSKMARPKANRRPKTVNP